MFLLSRVSSTEQAVLKTMAEGSSQDGTRTEVTPTQHIPPTVAPPQQQINLAQACPQGVARNKVLPTHQQLHQQQPVAGDIQALQQLLGQG